MTLDNLSNNEIKSIFDRDGVVGPFKAYEQEEAKEMLRKIRVKSIDSKNSMHKNNVGWDRHFDIQELSNHIKNPSILDKVSILLGEDLLCWRTEYFPKFPGSLGTDWHQVGNFQYVTGDPILLPTGKEEYVEITAWTAFTDATIENGTVRFIPGTHKKKYYDETKSISVGREGEYYAMEKDNFYGYDFEEFKINPDWNPDDMKHLTLDMKAGEFLLFISKCIHGSHPNTTKDSTRFAISSRYIPSQVRVYPNHDEFHGHGGLFQLKKSNYGAVLVNGQDTYGHNPLRKENNLGEKF